MSELCAIGEIIKPHGLQGECKVNSNLAEDFPWPRLVGIACSIGLESERVETTLASIRPGNAGWLVYFGGFECLESLTGILGKKLFVPREWIAPLLEKEEFFVSDLIGARVLCGGVEIGVVLGLEAIPNNPLLKIELTAGKVFLLPFQDKFVPVCQAGLVEVLDWEPFAEV